MVSPCAVELERVEFQAASLLQGSPIHPGSPAESGGWRKGREQPELNSSQRREGVRTGAEEIPRLGCSKDLQCEEKRSICYRLVLMAGRAGAQLCFLFVFTPVSHVCLLQAALLAAPYRSNFIKALCKGEEVKEEDCLAKVRQFLVNYTATVDAIYEMYTSLNAELDYTV